jgi:hypothetical protein
MVACADAADYELVVDFGAAAGEAGVEEVVEVLLLFAAGAFVSDFVSDFVSGFESDFASGLLSAFESESLLEELPFAA